MQYVSSQFKVSGSFSVEMYGSVLLTVASAAARRSAAEAGRDGTKTVKADTFTGMPLQEAKQVLNVQDLDDVEQIRTVCLLSKEKVLFDIV